MSSGSRRSKNSPGDSRSSPGENSTPRSMTMNSPSMSGSAHSSPLRHATPTETAVPDSAWHQTNAIRPIESLVEDSPANSAQTPNRHPHASSAFTPKEPGSGNSGSSSILRQKSSSPMPNSAKSVRFGETPKRHDDPPEILDMESEDEDIAKGVVFGNPDTFGAAGGDVAYSSPSVSERSEAIEGWKGGRGRKTFRSVPAAAAKKGNSDVLKYWSGASQKDRQDYENAEQWADMDPDVFAGVRDDSPSPEPPLERPGRAEQQPRSGPSFSPQMAQEPFPPANQQPVQNAASTPVRGNSSSPSKKKPQQRKRQQQQQQRQQQQPQQQQQRQQQRKQQQQPQQQQAKAVFDPFHDDEDESIVFNDNESSFFSATSGTEERNADTSPFRVILPPPRQNSASRERRQREATRDFDKHYARSIVSPPAAKKRSSRPNSKNAKGAYHQKGFYDDSLEI